MKLLLTAYFFVFISVKSYSQTKDELPPPPPPVDTALLAKKIYEKVEVEAGFPGGDNAWTNFLTKNLNPMVPIEHGAPLGKYTVWAQFIVDLEGNMVDIKPLTNWGYGMEDEVVRILKRVPGKWTPALQNGKPVEAYRKQPVTFVVSEEGFEVNLVSGKDVLFIGIDNPITVRIDKVKNKNLSASISQGTMEVVNGHYNIHVVTVGRAVITFYEKQKEIGAYSFEVKTLPTADEPIDGIHREEEDNENFVWIKTEIPVAFPGGDKAWREFLAQNLNANVAIENNARPGKYNVWIQFIVDKNGTPGNWLPLTANGYGLEDEAIRVLKKVSQWVPANQNGRNVKAYAKQLITFIVEKN